MSKVEWRPVQEILALCGITQDEAVEFLKGRGHKVSLGAIKAWGRGHYRAPEEAIKELWELWLGVYEDLPDIPLGDDAPDGAKSRRDTVESLRIWYDPMDPHRVPEE